ncbi:hypothetical protein chiPu_0026726, partial [Chiloscyllium punctatum]|nr:hypothetical protein [Chiloscyllium punctatum]
MTSEEPRVPSDEGGARLDGEKGRGGCAMTNGACRRTSGVRDDAIRVDVRVVTAGGGGRGLCAVTSDVAAEAGVSVWSLGARGVSMAEEEAGEPVMVGGGDPEEQEEEEEEEEMILTPAELIGKLEE